MGQVNLSNLDNVFSYHAPAGTQPDQYAKIREGAKAFARIILENTPQSADQSDAIRSVRNAMMTANAAVATGGEV